MLWAGQGIRHSEKKKIYKIFQTSGQSVGLGLPRMPPTSTGLLSGGQGRPGDMLEAGILSGGQGKPGDFLFYSQDGNQVKVAQVIIIICLTKRNCKDKH